MTLKKISICATALIAATIASQLAQAGGRGSGPNLGVSGSSPGHTTTQPSPPPSDPGKSVNAPGDIKSDTTGATNAKQFAPGSTNPNSKR